ncbi:MAG: DEAD/DEAH box helicase [Candidatus Izemoplasmatales bacterium]
MLSTGNVEKILKNETADVFEPIKITKNIEATYSNYIRSTFRTENDAYNSQIEKLLNGGYELVKGPYLQISENYKKGKSVGEFTGSLLSREFLKLNSEKLSTDMKLYEHQIDALRNIIEKDRSTVVSTGTGSGKTESFLIPILDHLMREVESGNIREKGVRAMLIYPMNALVNDQIARLKDLLCNYTEITFGFFTGDTHGMKSDDDYKRKYKTDPSANEIFLRSEMREAPPHILITNYAMLEHILIRPENSVEIFSPERAHLWKYVVLDEAHTYSGAKGAEVSMLLRRVRQTLGNKSLRFILTSATMGSGPGSNEEIAEFANSLTGSHDIEASDIIRAATDPINMPEEMREVPSEYYRKVLDSGYDPEVIRSVSASIDDGSLKHLGEVLIHDPNLWKVRRALEETVKTVSDISLETGLGEEEVVQIVNASGNAQDQMGRKVMESRYHVFIRSINGVHITLKPSQKLSFTAQKKMLDEEIGEEFRCFQMSACYNCDAIFLPGYEDLTNHKLKQLSDADAAGEEDIEKNDLFMLCGDSDYDPLQAEADERYAKSFMHLCSKCGTLSPMHGKRECGCGEQYSNLVRIALDDAYKDKLCECPRCGQRNNKFGIVRDYYLGAEAASSVLASSLFNEMPSPHVEEPDERRTKQILMFSDSRRSASYAAINLNDTHENILMHRIIREVTKKESFEKGVPFEIFVDEVAEIIAEVYGRDRNSDSGLSTSKALEYVCREAVSGESNKSLEYAGLLKFEVRNVPERFGDLTGEETRALFNQALWHIRSRGSVSKPYGIEDDVFRDSCKCYGTIAKTADSQKSKNQRVYATKKVKAYLSKVIGDENIAKFMDELFKSEYFDIGKDGYAFDLYKLYVAPEAVQYHCPKCRKKYPYSVKGICPKCLEESLVESPSDFYGSDDHFTTQYRDMPLNSMIVKEHTAQLNKQLLAEYQTRFKDRAINVLSCSTTFEMGVDIGSLSTVFMRNVPPSPSNYIQRAGRAGRSEESSAYVLTFCKNASHDAYYFHRPEEIISGKVKTPIVKVENPKVAIRHVFASAIAHFWKTKGEAPQSVGEFAEEEYFREIEDYVRSKPEDLRKFISGFLPKGLNEYSGGDATIDAGSFGWIDPFIGDDGRLRVLLEEYQKDMGTLDEMQKKSVEEDDFQTAGEVKKTKKTLLSENILAFLSRGNIIPKYGFPSDTVKLERAFRKDDDYDLQMDISQAIAEYAPGCQIIANGRLVESGYIKVVEGRAWEKKLFSKCEKCGTVVLGNYVNEEAKEEVLECPNCKEELPIDANNKFIVPRFGFQFKKDDKASINKVRRSRGKYFEYKGKEANNPVRFRINGLSGTLEHNDDDELITLSRDSYFVCEKCGYGARKNIAKAHELPYGKAKCDNKSLKKFKLGHIFRTDVLIISFDAQIPGSETGAAKVLEDGRSPESRLMDDHHSVLFALIEGLCTHFNIERTEVSGCLRHRGKSFDYVLLDNTPGGAGYVKAITEDNLMELISTSISILEKCDCGGPEGDGCCYNCLCNYNNQQYHDVMRRGVALRYLEQLRSLGEKE